MINAPLFEDKLALRGSVSYSDQDGWIDIPDLNQEDANAVTQLSTRIAALWTPNEKLTVEGSFFYQDQDIPQNQLQSTLGVLRPRDLEPFAGPQAQNDYRDIEYSVYNLTLTYDIGVASLVSSTSHFRYELDAITDLSPFVPIFFGALSSGGTGAERQDLTAELSTQELRLVSNGDERFDWTIGGFYKDNTRGGFGDLEFVLNDFFGIPGFTLADTNGVFYETESTAYALFADVDYELTDEFSLGAGLRYYVDDRKLTNILLVPSFIFGDDPTRIGIPDIVSGDDSATTPKVTLNWKPNDDILVFLKTARGFRNGGTNIGAITRPQYGINNDFGPESLWSYEGGVKTTWSGVTLNAYIYYNDWTDLQLLFRTPDGLQTFYGNAGSARSFGGELEVFAALPVKGWTANLSTGYTNAEISENVKDALGQNIAEKGNKIPYAPKWKINIATQYAKPLTDTLFGTIRASYTYRTETHSNPQNIELLKNESFDQVSASIGVEGKSWGVHLFADNLFDNDGTILKVRQVPNIQSIIYNSYVRPRTIGLRFIAEF